MDRKRKKGGEKKNKGNKWKLNKSFSKVKNKGKLK